MYVITLGRTIWYGPYSYADALRVWEDLYEPCGCGNPHCWINVFDIKVL